MGEDGIGRSGHGTGGRRRQCRRPRRSAQQVAAGETRQFPMQYFIAPEMVDDREVEGVNEITLSYTFYPVADDDGASNQNAARGGTGAG